VKSDGSGAFTLPLPVRKEVAITVAAPEFGSRLLPLATGEVGYIDWKLNMSSDQTLRARYAALDATPAVPDPNSPPPSVGALFVAANGPPGSTTGLDGVTISIAPVSGVGPLYFEPNGKPDILRKATSTFSYALFSNLTPGVVEVMLGPEALVCSPSYGGWPSDKRNTLRVPIVAWA
jgi:hypothetical protein